ncbi:unnamed protein product [Phaedon cochleariae]|uniref:Uncharacterized protein n=1 Tax=Phaedon cochleariae TaxID=80249 RepID=A0A9N9SJJ4_PHACE|nr:unnamed protein product [Phaedon cochleariae]
MGSFIIFAVAFIAVEALSFKEEWIDFKMKHGKSYDPKEEAHRYSIFQSNMLTIANHNRKYENGESTFEMGINNFADLTPEEFLAMISNPYIWNTTLEVEQASFNDVMGTDIPEEVDWRKKGAVTAVKKQGRCGSCWSFSATGTIEGQYFIKEGKLVSLSEQQMVDCATKETYKCGGCKGGYVNKALKYAADNGMMLENSYPYKAKHQSCQYNKSQVAVKTSSYKSVKKGDENELKKAVALVGPISVCITATKNFHLYKSGVFDDETCNRKRINHAVLVVGYGSLNGNDYWIVKNSWGAHWGQHGYILMSRNKDQCAIAYHAVYPVL